VDFQARQLLCISAYTNRTQVLIIPIIPQPPVYPDLAAPFAGPDLPDRNITSHDVKPKLDSSHLDPCRPGRSGQRLPPLQIDRSGHLWRSGHVRLVLGLPGRSVRQGPQEGRVDCRGEVAGVARAGISGSRAGEVGHLDEE
jgi:hypothetical protein